jgi:galactokinase
VLRGSGTAFDRYLAEDIYARGGAAYLDGQKARFVETVEAHRRRFGEAPLLLLRAPGRLNAFLEYLDMCAGDHMSTTIDGDVPLAVTARDDDTVVIRNTAPIFPERRFSIREELDRFAAAPWGTGDTAGLADTWDNRTRVYPYHGRPRGDHANYVVAAFLRFAWEHRGRPLRGANMTFGPSTIPLRGGTSSSSAIVVLSALTCLRANADVLPPVSVPELCRLLGEAEWYVGTHGGANDQTTILRNEPQGILYNRHSRRDLDSTPLPFLHGLRIVLANSLWEANKALGANYVFNMRKGWMDLGDDLLRRAIDDLAAGKGSREFDWKDVKARYHRFGSLDEGILGIPQAAIARLIQLLPREIDPDAAGALLGKDRQALARDYTLPDATDRVWRPRNAAVFFNKENVLGRSIESLLLEADGVRARGAATDSPAYDAYRERLGALVRRLHETIRDDFQVSNDQLELLLRVAAKGPGYLAGKLTGAGSGGCVCIFVREADAEAMCAHLDRAYYGVPEHFTAYRAEVARVADGEIRREMERNLDEALASVAAQRRVVSFSRGAGVLKLPA